MNSQVPETFGSGETINNKKRNFSGYREAKQSLVSMVSQCIKQTTTLTAISKEQGPNSGAISQSKPAEASPDAVRAKRSRRDSPVADSVKATIPDASRVDLPMLPIIRDAQLPDPKESTLEPDAYLLQLVKSQFGVSLKVRNGMDFGEDYFKPTTDEQHAAYTMEVLTPARDNDVEALKALVQQNGRQAVDAVNRFGESLLNLACRRGFNEVVEFLLSKEIDLDVRMKDDFGRTPFHDACWHPKPLLEICGLLIEKDPSLLLVSDKRGNTPFQYARAEDWPTWRQFLFDHRESLQLLTEPGNLKHFCC